MSNDGNTYKHSVSEDVSLAGSCQFGLNDSGTCKKIDTPLTQRRSGPVPEFAVIGPSGDAITGFDCALHAANWARRTWPHLDQDPDRTGKGWDIHVMGAE